MKRSKLLLPIVAVGTLVFTAMPAQPGQLDASLVRTAKAFEESMNRRDFNGVAASTNRKIVEALGGESAVVEAIRSSMQRVSYDAMRFHLEGSECSFVPPNAVCVLPYTMTVVVHGEAYVLESFYLASSSEDNARWLFADGNGASKPGAMEFLFPGYAGAPKLPAKTIPRKAAGQP
jgi:hypothetical protein